MLLSIPATVTVSSGTTYHFSNIHPPSRVTKLLAQFGMSHRKHCRFLSPKLFLSLPLAADRSMFKHWLIQSTKERFMKSYAGIITSIAILSTWTVTDCNAQIQSNPQLNTIIIG